MENWIIAFMSEFGYIGILLLIMFENVFPPIPSEVILTFGGFMTTYSNVTVFGIILAATIGSVVGAMILYSVGLIIDISRLEKMIDRWGKYLRLTQNDLKRAVAWFDKYGAWAVFLGRLVPLIRSLISIPAGMAGMNFPLFIFLTTLGSLLWNTVLILIGVAVADNWQSIVAYMGVYSNIVYVLLGIGLIFIGVRACQFYRKRA